MRTEATLTCRDTDDDAHWITRLAQADQAQCEGLIDAMMNLAMRLERKGIPAPGPRARLGEALRLYEDRFGVPLVPF